jgi:hypothetical protein
LDLDRIKTIFGNKNRPHRDTRKKNHTRWGVVVEIPTYDLTVFKVHYGKMTLKIYTKGERALRVEVIVRNTKEYRWGRSPPCFGEIVVRLRSILERFLNAVGCLDARFVADETLGEPATAHQDWSDQSVRDRFPQAQNAGGGRGGARVIDCADQVHSFRSGSGGCES